MKQTLLLSAILVASAVPSHAQVFRTETLTIDSAVNPGMTLTSYVCVPSDYDDHPARRYPVLYTFPGGTQPSQSNCDYWGELVEMMDMDPFIKISLEGRNVNYAGYNIHWNTWSNSPVSGRWVDYVVDEVVPAMDAKYRTLADRTHRMTWGISAGGYGSIWIPLRHPEVFANASSLQGASHFIDPCDLQPTPRTAGLPLDVTFKGFILSGYGSPPYTFKPTDHYRGNVLYGLAAAYSPNINNAPYRVDLPWDASGNNNLDVCQRWLEHNPANVVDELPAGTDLYFNIGLWTIDSAGPFAEMSRVLIDSLDAYGIPVDTLSVPCGHGFACPDDDNHWHTSRREKLWNLNNFIARGALSMSRDPAPLVASNEAYDFGLVYALQSTTTKQIINFGPGPVDVLVSVDSSYYEVSPASLSIAEGDTAEVEIVFAPRPLERLGSHPATITLEHAGVGVRQISLAAYARVTGIATETLPTLVHRFEIFPNPAVGRVEVEIELAAAQWIEAALVDVLGREQAILQRREHLGTGTHRVTWEVDRISPGLYFVRLRTKSGAATRPVVVMR